MVRKILSFTAVALLVFSGCSATKAEVKKTETKEVKKAVDAQKTKAVAKKAKEKINGVAASVPASEFFKK